MTQANQITVGIEIGIVLAKASRGGISPDDLIAALEHCIALCRLDAALSAKLRAGSEAHSS